MPSPATKEMLADGVVVRKVEKTEAAIVVDTLVVDVEASNDSDEMRISGRQRRDSKQ